MTTTGRASEFDSLRPADLELHSQLGIQPDLLVAARVRRVTHEQARDDCGIRYRSEHLEGIWYPVLDPERGTVRGGRVRRDHPELDADGRPVAKYLAPPDRHHLYFTPGAGPRLADTSVPVTLVESEKASLALTAAAMRANRPILVIGLGGCWGWRGTIGKTTDATGARVDEKGPLPDLDRIAWRDRDVVILFDANAATNPKVQAARRSLAAELIGRGARVRVADLPTEEGINGPDDFIGAHGAVALFALLDARPNHDDGGEDRGDGREKKESQATILLRLAREAGAECFHDDDQPYLHVPVGDHYETYPLRSRLGRAWLQGLYIDATQKCAGTQAIADASNALEALALRGPEHHVHVRLAAADVAIYLDLGDGSGKAVEIRATGWQVVSTVPVRFRRPKGLLALPTPVSGGSITALRPFVNLASQDDFVLLVMTLVGMLRGRGPYPVLVANGEQGSAKSTLARVIKALVDPTRAPLRSEPREPRDLMIAASNNHLLAFDNLSGISPWLSDCFCRLATGGGFSTRMLYENSEEQLFHAVRPLIVNGIVELATRPDLVSRAVLLSLPRITDQECRDEKTFWAAFEQARPALLGALLDIVVKALANETGVQLAEKPRMADFAVWAVAAEPACPWPVGSFMKVYAGNRQQAAEATLDGDPVGDLVRALAKGSSPWTGTASDLLKVLNERTPEATQRRRDWYKQPRQVGDCLRRLAPALRQVGIDVRFSRVGHTRARVIELEQVRADASSASAASARSDSRDGIGGRSADASEWPSSAASASASADPTNVYRDRDDADAADDMLPVRSNVQLHRETGKL